MKPSKCIIPTDERLRELLTESDLKSLFGEEVFYIKSQPSERTEKVLLELGAKPVGPRNIVDLLKMEKEAKNKSKAWFLNLYEYLSTFFDTSNQWYWGEEKKALFEVLKKTKFIIIANTCASSLRELMFLSY